MARQIMPVAVEGGWPVVDLARQEVALESVGHAIVLVDMLRTASLNDGDVGQVDLKTIVDALAPQLRRALDTVLGALDDPAETPNSLRMARDGK